MKDIGMPDTKPRRGRPPLEVTQDKIVAVRLADIDHERLERLAEKDETKAATLGRKAIKQYLDRRGA